MNNYGSSRRVPILSSVFKGEKSSFHKDSYFLIIYYKAKSILIKFVKTNPMIEKLPQKITKFISDNEILLVIIILVFMGLKYLHFPGSALITIIGLQSIASLYFISGFDKNTDIPKTKQFINKLIGISSGLMLIGILFSSMRWPGWHMQLIVGSIAVSAALIYSGIKKGINIKKETQLRLVALLIIGLSLYFLSKPGQTDLYRTVMTDFNIERVYEQKNRAKESNQIPFNDFLHNMKVNFITEEEEINYSKSQEQLNSKNNYFIIAEPKFNADKSISEIHLINECGTQCSFSGDYIYEIKGNKWIQTSQKNVINF